MTPARTRTALALTLATAPLLIATTAHAATPCGAPAVDAVFQNIHHDAVSHVESRWSHKVIDTPGVDAWDEPDVVVPATYKTVTVQDAAAYDETVVDQAAYDETVVDQAAYDETVVDTAAYDETVVDQAAYDQTVVDRPAWVETVVDQPGYTRLVIVQQAVWGTMVEWRFFGSYRYLPSGQNPGGGYWQTGYTYPYLVTPQITMPVWVPPITHEVYHDAVTHTVHHDAVTHTVHHDAVTHDVHHDAVTHTVHHDAVTHDVHHDAVTHTVHHDAVTHDEQVVDVAEHNVPGAHHDAVAEVAHLEYQWATTAPAADWVQTGESRVVIDRAATDTQVVLTPAQPAGAACPAPVPVPKPTTSGNGSGSGSGSGNAGGNGNGGAGTSPAKAPAVSAASAVPVLAHTGADGTGELLPLGGLLVLAGAGAHRVARRRG